MQTQKASTQTQLKAVQWINGLRKAMDNYERANRHPAKRFGFRLCQIKSAELEPGMTIITVRGNRYIVSHVERQRNFVIVQAASIWRKRKFTLLANDYVDVEAE